VPYRDSAGHPLLEPDPAKGQKKVGNEYARDNWHTAAVVGGRGSFRGEADEA
jgi:hypothetical protein